MNSTSCRGSTDTKLHEFVLQNRILFGFDGAEQAMQTPRCLLYGIAFTIKMSKKGDHQIEGYFDYVVPPLEGFWRQEGVKGIDYARKDDFKGISAIRLPDFLTESVDSL